MRNKKGLNSVIVVGLIILLAIAAIILIWSFVNPLITDIGSEISSSCLILDLKPSACSWDSSTGLVQVRVVRGADSDEIVLSSLKLVFGFADGSSTVEDIRDLASIPDALEARVLFPPVYLGSSIPSPVSFIELAGVVEVNGREQTCNIAPFKIDCLATTVQFQCGNACDVFVRGDVNEDNVVDERDEKILEWYLDANSSGTCVSSSPACLNAVDVNADGIMTPDDTYLLQQHLFSGGPAPPLPNVVCPGGIRQRGDVNDDGNLSVSDIAVMAPYVICEGSSPVCVEIAGDADDNNLLDYNDVTAINSFWSSGSPTPPNPYPHRGVDSPCQGSACACCFDNDGDTYGIGCNPGYDIDDNDPGVN